MPNLLTKDFRIHTANLLRDDIFSNRSNIYFFMGGIFPWNSQDIPENPEDTLRYKTKVYDNIVAAKRITPLDVKNVIKRINWERNTVYAEYDDLDKNLYDKNFYVLNSEFNVYKCISNNSNQPSDFEPKGTPLLIFTTADGYKWKFLYTIPPQDQLRFLTRNWMPVITDPTVKFAANDGGIENLKIFSGGINYSPRTSIVVDGDQERNANILARVRLGSIFDYQIVDFGSKYRNATISFDSGGSGRLANIRPIIGPIGGHGYDNIKELGANYLMFNIRTNSSEGGIFLPDIIFRQIGLLKDPRLRNSDTILSNTIISFTDVLNLNQVNGTFVKDEYIVGQVSGANLFSVAANNSISSNTTSINFIQSIDITKNFKTPAIGETVIGTVSGSVGRVVNISKVLVEDDLGEILYLENLPPIKRSRDQSENLHLVIEF